MSGSQYRCLRGVQSLLINCQCPQNQRRRRLISSPKPCSHIPLIPISSGHPQSVHRMDDRGFLSSGRSANHCLLVSLTTAENFNHPRVCQSVIVKAQWHIVQLRHPRQPCHSRLQSAFFPRFYCLLIPCFMHALGPKMECMPRPYRRHTTT